MGSRLSRARGAATPKLRSVKKTDSPDWQTRPSEPLPGGELAKQEEVMASSFGKLEESSEAHEMAQLFNKLGGSIAGRPMERQLWKDPIRRRGRREAEEEAEHRLALLTLRSLLEDAQRISTKSDDGQAIKELADSYDVDPVILEKVLRYNALPVCTSEEDGRIIGRWPS